MERASTWSGSSRKLFPSLVEEHVEKRLDKKVELELRLLMLVCQGALYLVTAQHDIAADWIEAYKRYGGEKYHGSSD